MNDFKPSVTKLQYYYNKFKNYTQISHEELTIEEWMYLIGNGCVKIGAAGAFFYGKMIIGFKLITSHPEYDKTLALLNAKLNQEKEQTVINKQIKQDTPPPEKQPENYPLFVRLLVRFTIKMMKIFYKKKDKGK